MKYCESSHPASQQCSKKIAILLRISYSLQHYPNTNSSACISNELPLDLDILNMQKAYS